MKRILIILDGAAGLGLKCFSGKTVLEIAKTPNLDFFTKNGMLGYVYPINEKTIPGSDNAIVSIFGNDSSLSKRGVFSAIGSGMKFKKGNLALRINFGTIDNLDSRRILDRRAGRTLTTKEAKQLAESLNRQVKLPCKFKFKSTIQHRAVLVLRGNFSDKITDIDPEYGSKKLNKQEKSNKLNKLEFSRSLDGHKESIKGSEILNSFVKQSFKILDEHPVNLERKKKGLFPANIILTRGPGVKIPKLKKYKNWMSINAMPLEIGISKISGMKIFSFEYPKLNKIDVYANLYDGLKKTIRFGIKILKKNYRNFEGCYIQFKETDVPGHDNKPLDKKKMMEIIDKKFFGFLKKFLLNKEIDLAVTCDHSTPCKLKRHSSDPVPVLVYNNKDKDKTSHFSESQSKKGIFGKIYGQNLLKKIGFFK